MLYEYLKLEWEINNHSKYQKYFEEWFNNLTNIQLYYFKIDYDKSNKKSII